MLRRKEMEMQRRFHRIAGPRQCELEGPRFDPDLPPDNVHNKEAARAHKLKYDPKKKAYVDEDGCLVRDRYGQPL